MQEEQRNLINTHLDKLVQLTEVQSFAKSLVSNRYFTSNEIDDIFNQHNEMVNNRKFFEQLLDKPNSVFNMLIDWLNIIGQNRLACKLAVKTSGANAFIDPLDEQSSDSEQGELVNSFETELKFDDSTQPLDVKVQMATEFMDSRRFNPHTGYYSSRSKKRGRVLIINNYDFDGRTHKPRTGAKVDEDNVKKLFEQMGGYVVKVKCNQTAHEMKNSLKSFTKEKREKRCDICLVFIMSHGAEHANETIIYGIDNQYLSISQIQQYFSNEDCPLFRGKPKVFIFQVCRGHDLDLLKKYPRTEHDGRVHKPDPTQNDSTTFAKSFRPMDDILTGYATMQGSKAHRDPYRGTWYIELICKNFMELAKTEPVDHLLMKVDEELRQRTSEMGTVQTAEQVNRGFRKLYLNPGIYEENGKLLKFGEESDQ